MKDPVPSDDVAQSVIDEADIDSKVESVNDPSGQSARSIGDAQKSEVHTATARNLRSQIENFVAVPQQENFTAAEAAIDASTDPSSTGIRYADDRQEGNEIEGLGGGGVVGAKSFPLTQEQQTAVSAPLSDAPLMTTAEVTATAQESSHQPFAHVDEHIINHQTDNVPNVTHAPLTPAASGSRVETRSPTSEPFVIQAAQPISSSAPQEQAERPVTELAATTMATTAATAVVLPEKEISSKKAVEGVEEALSATNSIPAIDSGVKSNNLLSSNAAGNVGTHLAGDDGNKQVQANIEIAHLNADGNNSVSMNVFQRV